MYVYTKILYFSTCYCYCVKFTSYYFFHESESEFIFTLKVMICLTLQRQQNLPPIFLFVMDTCVDEEELGALRESITMSLSLMPATALVGLITFGRHVHVSTFEHSIWCTAVSWDIIFNNCHVVIVNFFPVLLSPQSLEYTT